MTTLVAFDCETHRIAAGNIAPPMICGIFTVRDDEGRLVTDVLGNHPDDCLEDTIREMLESSDTRIITQGGGFDYAVICRTFPGLIPLVYAKLIAGGATDTKWRERLLNLSTTGRLEKLEMPDGSKVNIHYSMQALAEKYLGVDLSGVKENAEESWRTCFEVLDGWKAEEYPEDAYEYAAGDGEYTLRIYEAQELRKEEWKIASTATEEFQLTKDFVLYMMTAWGMEVDPEATEEMAAKVDVVMAENKDLLEESGILRPLDAIGPPYAKDMEKAYEILLEHIPVDDLPAEMGDSDWNQYKDLFVDSGVRFKKPKGKPGSKDTAVLQAHLAKLYHELGEIPSMTAGGENREPQIQCDEEIREYLATKCPIMAQYNERAALGKIATQMIPVLRSGPVVYPRYDAIKETGRTSSYDGGMFGKERAYASANIQNIPNLIRGLDPRQCFRPRDGTVFWDVDYTGLELACVGHVTYGLFGESVHRNLYNAGIDLHGYLGGQLALQADLDSHPLTRDFQSACREEGIGSDPMAVYEAFRLLKIHDDEEVRGFFKHFRTFAKPTGLGFPGGLGPDTMVTYARKTYGVIMTVEEAHQFREFWRATYPEMPKFFDWVNGQTDEYNGSDAHTYTTDMGLVRRGATFCATANGVSMQSPGAEAAMAGTILVSRACYDPTQESVLYGCRPIAFVHDQNIGETTKDPELWAPQCEEVARLMREGAEMILDSMKMRTDEALLTAVWSKSAEPVRDENGVLQVWTPN